MTKQRINIFIWCYGIVIIALPLLLSYFKISDTINTLVMYIVLAGLIVFLNHYADIITGLEKDNIKIRFLKTLNICLLVGVIIFTQALQFPLASYVGETKADHIWTILGSIVMMVFSNYAPKLPFNKYVGYRLPWTVRDEDTWRYCHRIVGYMGILIGLVQIVLAMFMPAKNFIQYTLLIWIVVPGVMSYVFYKKKARNKVC